MKDGFVYKRWWRDVLLAYPKQVREEVNNAIITYGLLEELISLKTLAWAAFKAIKEDIDRDRKDEERLTAKSLRMREVVRHRWNKRKSDADAQVDTNVYTSGDSLVLTVEEEEKVDKEKANKKKNVIPASKAFDERTDTFYKTLVPYVDRYGREMVRHFFDYWSEPNKSRTKMRWETEKTFEINRRLATWARRDKSFSNGRTTTQERINDALDVMRTLERESQESDDPL